MADYIIQGEKPAHWHVQFANDADLIEYVMAKGDTLFDELDTEKLAICDDPPGRDVAVFIRKDGKIVGGRVAEIEAINDMMTGGARR